MSTRKEKSFGDARDENSGRFSAERGVVVRSVSRSIHSPHAEVPGSRWGHAEVPGSRWGHAEARAPGVRSSVSMISIRRCVDRLMNMSGRPLYSDPLVSGLYLRVTSLTNPSELGSILLISAILQVARAGLSSWTITMSPT